MTSANKIAVALCCVVFVFLLVVMVRTTTADVSSEQSPRLAPEMQAAVDKKVQAQQQAQVIASRRAADQAAVNARPRYAQELESSLLSRGMDAHVRAVGKNQQTLRISWAGMSRPVVYNMINSPGMLEEVPALGFTSVVMTDDGSFSGGDAETWRYRWTPSGWRQ